MSLSPQQCLALAQSHIKGVSLDDLGSRLGRANLPFGLAKILWVQQQLGVTMDASFQVTADFAITRNRTRWKQGFAYGGLVTFSGPFVVLDLKPNACGMLVGGLGTLPSLSDWPPPVESGCIRVPVQGELAEWDFETSNHFFQVYAASWVINRHEFKTKYVFIVHGSGDEHRHLLYYDREDFAFADRVRCMETPWGPLHLLLGADADAYYGAYREAEHFARLRREAFARFVLGDFQPISHSVHQGFAARGVMALGSQIALSGGLYPFAQQERLPAYLLALPEGKGDGLLPHGSGYRLTSRATEVSVTGQTDGERRFVLAGPESAEPLDDIRGLEYTYRGAETLNLVLASSTAEVVAELTPLLRITAEGLKAIS